MEAWEGDGSAAFWGRLIQQRRQGGAPAIRLLKDRQGRRSNSNCVWSAGRPQRISALSREERQKKAAAFSLNVSHSECEPHTLHVIFPDICNVIFSIPGQANAALRAQPNLLLSWMSPMGNHKACKQHWCYSFPRILQGLNRADTLREVSGESCFWHRGADICSVRTGWKIYFQWERDFFFYIYSLKCCQKNKTKKKRQHAKSLLLSQAPDSRTRPPLIHLIWEDQTGWTHHKG